MDVVAKHKTTATLLQTKSLACSGIGAGSDIYIPQGHIGRVGDVEGDT